MEKLYTLLALGDSYTIGEGVTITESFPYQVVEALRKKGLNFSAPEIIAKTGWTTDELSAAIDAHKFLTKYDFVTILIGVNNQYRSRTVEEYKLELEGLLKKALQFADGKKRTCNRYFYSGLQHISVCANKRSGKYIKIN